MKAEAALLKDMTVVHFKDDESLILHSNLILSAVQFQNYSVVVGGRRRLQVRATEDEDPAVARGRAANDFPLRMLCLR